MDGQAPDLSHLSDDDLKAIALPKAPDLSHMSDDDLAKIAGSHGGPSATLSAGRKFAQGASAGFSDELSGALDAGGRAVGIDGLGSRPVKDISINPSGPTLDTDQLKQAYLLGRDHERAALKTDASAHPAISAVADMAGSVMSPVNKVMGPLGVVGGGAVVGGVQALGNSDADTVGGLAKDTAIGTGLGAIMGKGAQIATPLLEAGVTNIGQKAKDAADMLSARALGAERGTIKKFGKDAVQAAGRYGLDNNIVTPLGNTESKIAANEATKQAAMDSRKAAYEAIDKSGASQFNPLDAATKAEQKVIGGKNPNHDDVKQLAETLNPHLSNILSRGDGNIPMSEAQTLVESLAKSAKFDTSRSTTANQVAKDVYQSVRQSINEAAEKGADQVGVDGLRQTIEKANADYSAGKTAQELLRNKYAREEGNKMFGLTDVVMGTGAGAYGAATGDWEHAGEAMLLKKGLEKYGPQIAAKGLDGLANKLLSVPEISALAQKSPAAFSSILSHFEGSPASLPAAAQNAPTKGPDKWFQDGADKLIQHATSPQDKDAIEKLKGAAADPKTKQLFIQASDLKPGSKAMEAVLSKIKAKSKIASDE